MEHRLAAKQSEKPLGVLWKDPHGEQHPLRAELLSKRDLDNNFSAFSLKRFKHKSSFLQPPLCDWRWS